MNVSWIVAGVALGAILFVTLGVSGAVAAAVLIVGIGFVAAQATGEGDHV
jgi:hypothetical protein